MNTQVPTPDINRAINFTLFTQRFLITLLSFVTKFLCFVLLGVILSLGVYVSARLTVMSNVTAEDPEANQAGASTLLAYSQVMQHENTTFQPLESPNLSEAVTNSAGELLTREESVSPKPFEACVVCGDKSSGKHYGVFTCEGCKSFFKRSIRRGLIYTCRTFRNCTIDLHHRNHCQYCRLQKCLNAGMKKEAVQKGRISSAGTETLSAVQRGVDSSVQSFYSNYVALLLRADTIARFQQSVGVMPTNTTGQETMSELAMRLLISAVEWARNIPFYTEFMLSDQSVLLRSCWSELFILNAAQYSSFHLTPPPSAHALPNGGAANSECDESIRVFEEQVGKLKSLQIDSAEFSCLKAIILFNPDSQGLSNSSHVENLQERTQAALEDYTRTQYCNQPTRFGKLLLRLPSLRLIRPGFVEGLFFSALGGVGHGVENALNEMLIAGSITPSTQCNW